MASRISAKISNEERERFWCLIEMGTWLNARSFSDPSRQPVVLIGWFRS
jgi:hypothetical protein